MTRPPFGLRAAALAAIAAGVVAAAAAQDLAAPELPAGEGAELVDAICSGCHSLRLVLQQGMSRDRWAETIDWMVEEQGMAELDAETGDAILDYLAAHFGDEFRAGAPSPFFQPPPLAGPAAK